VSTQTGALTGFQPPPYPYERLVVLRREASALPGGMVDLSVGSPCDPPSPRVIEALAAGDEDGATRGYPSSAGSPAARRAIVEWAHGRLGAAVDPDLVALCIGTKELVAGLPGWLHRRDPSRDTVLYPALAYPTYEMGALLAGLRPVAVPVDGQFRLDLDAVLPEDAARALVLWVNSPGNPAGQLEDLDAMAEWGHRHGVLVASDECYAELTWSGPPQTLLGRGRGRSGHEGVLAVHSLSKRSNLAGLRFGWYAGDPEVVRFLREVRQHAGFMVPGAVQRAGIAALADQAHADRQRGVYRDRLARLRELLAGEGAAAPMPEGGLYVWARAPGGGSWAFVSDLAARGGLVVSPGEFYGPAGEGYVRAAAVAPLERIELAAQRLASSPRDGADRRSG
jgi:succinyldiaminopimelate transaminase